MWTCAVVNIVDTFKRIVNHQTALPLDPYCWIVSPEHIAQCVSRLKIVKNALYFQYHLSHLILECEQVYTFNIIIIISVSYQYYCNIIRIWSWPLRVNKCTLLCHPHSPTVSTVKWDRNHTWIEKKHFHPSLQKATTTTIWTGSRSNVRSLSLCLWFKPVFVEDNVHVEDEWQTWQTRFDSINNTQIHQ